MMMLFGWKDEKWNSLDLKEANESRYWINLLIKSNSVPETKFKPLLAELTAKS
jgi:hypothetical protein